MSGRDTHDTTGGVWVLKNYSTYSDHYSLSLNAIILLQSRGLVAWAYFRGSDGAVYKSRRGFERTPPGNARCGCCFFLSVDATVLSPDNVMLIFVGKLLIFNASSVDLWSYPGVHFTPVVVPDHGGTLWRA